MKPKWKAEFEHELEQARSAREGGNEGMARVCARRAAGIVIGEYLARQGYKEPSPSAYERLKLFNSLLGIDEQLKTITSHFLLKVKDDRSLPEHIDLVREAVLLMRCLLLDNTN